MRQSRHASTRVATPSGTIGSQPAQQTKDIGTLARETIRGVYGVGASRRAALGPKYAAVQARQRVARLNGIRAPYTIYPGQRLRY